MVQANHRYRAVMLSFMLGLIAACDHDAALLGPQPEDSTRLLPELGEDCFDCRDTHCDAEAQACLKEKSCNRTLQDCSPPNPTCGTSSPVAANFALCLRSRCEESCTIKEFSLACRGQYSWPLLQQDESIPIEVAVASFTPQDDGGPAQVEVCGGLEGECHVESSASVVLGQAGVMLQYKRALLGRLQPYLQVTAEGFVPLLVFHDMIWQPGYPTKVYIVSARVYAGLLLSLGTASNGAQGTVYGVFYDCTGKRLPGVMFELWRDGSVLPTEAQGVPFYFKGNAAVNVPAASATDDKISAGGFANVEPGMYELVARTAADGKVIGRATSVFVRGGALTQVLVFPLTRGEE